MSKVNFRITKMDATKILLAAIFISLVFFPLIRVLSYLDIGSIKATVSSYVFPIAVRNSLFSTAVATILTVLLAFVLVLCMERTHMMFKGIISIIVLLPMLVPSISNGMGLVILFGNNGIFTKMFQLEGNIYGFWGIVLGGMLYAFPVAYLMLTDVIRYEDGTPYEAANVLGISKIRQFGVITLPYLRKPIITTVFAVFTMIITDYGVPLMVGGKYSTVPLVMYQEVIGQLNFSKGSVYATVLLFPAIVAFVIDLLCSEKANRAYVTKKYPINDSIITKVIATIIGIGCVVFTVLPILSFVLLAFSKNYPTDLSVTMDNILKTLKLNADTYFINSVLIAILTALIGTGIAFMTAYLSARVKSKTSKFLHLSAMTSAAIPGIVLGLAYVLTFKGSFVYGTIVMLLLVNLVHFISSPYLMIYNSLCKVNENIEAVAHTLGVDRFHMIKDIFVPICKVTILEMLSYFFVNCMMTISAVSFLANSRNKPISLMINQFEAQSQLEYAAVVSLMILAMNLLVKGIFHLLKSEKHTMKSCVDGDCNDM